MLRSIASLEISHCYLHLWGKASDKAVAVSHPRNRVSLILECHAAEASRGILKERLRQSRRHCRLC